MYCEIDTVEKRKSVDTTPKSGVHPVLREKWIQTLQSVDFEMRQGIWSKNGVQIAQERVLADAHHISEEQRKDVSRLAEDISYYLGNNEVLTEEEFVNEMQKNIDNNTMKKFISELARRHFYCIDLNNDGEISVQEFKLFYKFLDDGETHNAEKAFKFIDANRDGVISMKEYQDAFVKYFSDESVTLQDLPIYGLPFET